ncbi:hypothetical protein B0H14DRAFT_3642837 [Mycena olivaceomarginata]|nr:hypothetical protein B0H14DRAFT_3642837 [Mycena olivaceomarginata]
MEYRTGNGPIGEYYQQFVPSEDYEGLRHTLRKASRDLSLPEILGTPEGVEDLAEFLEKSGAFTKNGKKHREVDLPTYDDKPDPEMSEDEDEEEG